MTLTAALQPIDWGTVDKALRDWVNDLLVLSGRVFWENQQIPQLAYPYATLKRKSLVRVGGVPEIRTSTDLGQPLEEEIEILATSPEVFTLSVTTYVDLAAGSNDSNTDAFKFASKVRASLGLPTVLAALRVAGLSIVEDLPVQDTTVVVNAEWESRATFDVRMMTASQMSEQTGYIDKAAIESTPLGVSFTVDAS